MSKKRYLKTHSISQGYEDTPGYNLSDCVEGEPFNPYWHMNGPSISFFNLHRVDWTDQEKLLYMYINNCIEQSRSLEKEPVTPSFEVMGEALGWEAEKAELCYKSLIKKGIFKVVKEVIA